MLQGNPRLWPPAFGPQREGTLTAEGAVATMTAAAAKRGHGCNDRTAKSPSAQLQLEMRMVQGLFEPGSSLLEKHPYPLPDTELTNSH